jgi:hypothetical protein
VPTDVFVRLEGRGNGGDGGGAMPAGPMSRAGGTAAHADGPRVVAERRGRPQRTGAASADERGGRAGPRLAGARVDGGLRGPACAAREARVRRWVRIWSITDVWVMKATMRIAPWQVGHLSGSTSKICWRRAAHRRVAYTTSPHRCIELVIQTVGSCGIS